MNRLSKFLFIVLIFSFSLTLDSHAQNFDLLDIKDKPYEINKDSSYLFVFMGHPLCRACAEQINQKIIRQDKLSKYSIFILSYQEPNIRDRKLKSGYFKSIFESKFDILFINPSGLDFLSASNLKYPFFIVYNKGKITPINYESIFDEYGKLKISHLQVANLFN